MDIIPRFYIFGVPDGFDILDGTSAEITYFQKFYNGSTENTKFSIHRDTKGNITYAYLKYNLSSGKSRTGSFFGMSLIFNNVYCANPLRLYELFDWVYNSYVVIDEEKEKQGKEIGFIRAIKNNKDIQARYDITRFQDKREYIQRYIESVLLGNINKEFKDAFCVIDSSFSNEHPNLVVQEPKESVSNEKLLADLQQYNRVAVSPDWAPKIPPKTGKSPIDSSDNGGIVLAPEYIVSLLDYTKGYQSYIIESLSDLESADVEMANAVFKEVESRLKEVKSTPSTDKRVLQIITDYTTLTEQLQSLIQKIEDRQTSSSPLPPPPIPWWRNPKILVVIGSIAGVVLIGVLIFLFVNIKGHTTSTMDQAQIELKIRTLITQGNFDDALTLAESSLSARRYQHFLDSIQDIKTCKNINDTINKRYFSDAWKLTKQLKFTNVEKIQRQIIADCTNYLQNETNAAVTKENAKSTKLLIQNCKVPIDNTKKTAMITKLDKIIGKEDQNQTKVSTSEPKYRIEIWKCTRETNVNYDWEDKERKHTINEDETITGQYFYYRLMKSTDNGSTWSSCGYNVAKDCIKVSDEALRTKGSGDGAYKVLNKTGTITVMDENKEKQFTITINN